MKHSITYLLLFCILPFFATSCEEEDIIEETTFFTYEIISPTFMPDKETKAIKIAYTDAFENAEIKYDAISLTNTPESIVLKACHEAEGAILTSSIKFDTRYTCEIFKITGLSRKRIYRKVYGIKKFEWDPYTN